MQHREFTKSISIAMCLALGCTSATALGCGSEGGDTTIPMVETELLGVYSVNSHEESAADSMGGEACNQLFDVEGVSRFLVLYSFASNDDPEEAQLGGVFCSDVDDCEDAAARAPEPTIGYSFVEGDDQSGWRGVAISRTGAAGDQCSVDV